MKSPLFSGGGGGGGCSSVQTLRRSQGHLSFERQQDQNVPELTFLSYFHLPLISLSTFNLLLSRLPLYPYLSSPVSTRANDLMWRQKRKAPV